MKYVAMFLICFVVGGSLVAVVYLFFGRLNKIERDRWGDKAKSDTQESFRSILAVFRKKKKA